MFTISTELSPIASPAFEVGRPTTLETTLSRLLEKAIRRSSALDTESLCLIAGKACFHVKCDIHVLSYEGNLVDACSLAALAALLHFKRPDTSVEGESVRVYGRREREPIPLSILHWPMCISFSFFESGSIILVDSALIEEQCREGEIVITMNAQGECCQISKHGGTPVDALAMLNCVQIAVTKTRELTKWMKGKLEEDRKKRDQGGLMAELSAENERTPGDRPGV